ncbi:MAG: hypothetical protein U0166_13710 [Acidobacteriota bacterium]
MPVPDDPQPILVTREEPIGPVGGPVVDHHDLETAGRRIEREERGQERLEVLLPIPGDDDDGGGGQAVPGPIPEEQHAGVVVHAVLAAERRDPAPP